MKNDLRFTIAEGCDSLIFHKLKIVEEEADETAYWLETLTESKILNQAQVAAIAKETDEILAMTVASLKTLRGRKS